MNNPIAETLEDVARFAEEHLLPEIQESVEVCIACYNLDDSFNDSWTFGTQLWRNTWNRFKSAASFEDCPFEVYGKGNEYKLKISRYILRHHKIDRESRLPSGAKAVKESAQMSLFSLLDAYPVQYPIIDNVVIAIDANVQSGLKEVFVGELMPYALDSKKFKWVNRAPVFLAEGHKASTDEFVSLPNLFTPTHAPVEEISEPVLKFIDEKKEKKAANDTEK